MEMVTDIDVEKNKIYRYSHHGKLYNLCSVLLIFVFGLLIGSLYLKIVEQKGKIEQLDAELQNISNWSSNGSVLISAMQEKIDRLVKENELSRQIEETDSNLTNHYHKSQLRAQEKIQQFDAELKNISDWRARLELIPALEEKIANLATEDQLLRRMGETNSNLTESYSDSLLQARKETEEISFGLEEQSNLQKRNLILITVFEQPNIKIRNSAFKQTSCLEKVNETIVTVRPCQEKVDGQFWLWTKNGEIRNETRCLDYDGTNLILYSCHNLRGHQLWKYNYKGNTIQHGKYSTKCLSVSNEKKRLSLQMETCDTGYIGNKQRWDFETPFVY